VRKQLCDALVARSFDPNMVFLTGDLGFMALEALQAALGERFINVGVAEQNMVSVSAALARQGFDVWAYSIAPFCYARPFEQIRNDVAFHKMPVRLIGNGGGYGYGVMGPTHHAIEDYGVLLTLPHMSVFTPVFDEDIADVIPLAGAVDGPAYLRLGRGEGPKDFERPAYSAWRQLVRGDGMTVVAVGPLAGTYIEAFAALPAHRRPNLWALSELPIERNPPPQELLQQMADGPGVCVAEEHVRQGGAGAQLALHLAQEGLRVKTFRTSYALAHHYERYGSQRYLRAMSNLDPVSVLKAIEA
jgi:transketolase